MTMNKKTVVIGASDNPDRYAYKAVKLLSQYNHEVIALGIKPGNIDGLPIETEKPILNDVNTITLYISPERQDEWLSYMLSVHPRRIIFNPGTENDKLANIARAHGIATEEACTLVLLNTGQY
jgi:uncharacterized protein